MNDLKAPEASSLPYKTSANQHMNFYIFILLFFVKIFCLPGSVADPDPNPDPDPPDPRVFGPPGSRSGSTSHRYGSGSGSCSGSGSFYHHAKIVRKPLIPTIL